ncbi:MAG TPA: VOC family protein [Acidimicrobiales bacterium]|nr:VOC family protein [Acidimicrobiales bacterium]
MNSDTDLDGAEGDGPLIPVRCLSHLGVTVSDLQAATGFYTRVLGFSPKYENAEHGWTRVGLALGDIVLELFSPHPASGSDDPYNPFYPGSFGRPKLALTVDNAAVAYEQAVAAGVVPKCPITETSVSKFFFIIDPDGTPVQLQEFTGGGTRLADLFP